MNPQECRYLRLLDAVWDLRQSVQLTAARTLAERDCDRLCRALEPYSDLQTVRVFLEDCRRATREEADFSATRSVVSEQREPIILGFFSAPYNRELGLEMVVVRPSPAPPEISCRYPGSRAAPVELCAATPGFQGTKAVALFPENFVALEPTDRLRIFYFVNKFVRRFEIYTKPVLQQRTEPRSFWRAKRATPQIVESAMGAWLYLHEYFHACGPLPLPGSLRFKSSRDVAAVEEAKVDMQAVLACIEYAHCKDESYMTYAEIILAERLVRYPIHSDPAHDYDARGSQLLFRFLQSVGAIELSGDMFSLKRPEILRGLAAFRSQILGVEEAFAAFLDTRWSVESGVARDFYGDFITRHQPVESSNDLGLNPFFSSARTSLAKPSH